MKRKQEKPAYDRIAAGERLRCRRLELGRSAGSIPEPAPPQSWWQSGSVSSTNIMRISSGEPAA